MKDLLTDAAARAARYLAELPARNVAPTPQAVQALAQFDVPLPDQGRDARQVLAMLDEYGSPATLASAGGRFFGFVIGGALPVTVAANWLAAAWDQNTALHLVTPATSVLEQVSLNWLLDVLKLPADCAGSFVTGATVANFTALAAARHAVLKWAGWHVEADGLFGAPPITVIVGAEAHPTLFKSLGMLGLGRNRVVRVPVDSQGRMRVDALPSVSGPTIVCTQTGNVNTGSFDPVGRICDHFREAAAWVHVDGAFGLWASASPATEHLTAGVDKADSWATDAHKWLNVPYDSGLAFVRHAGALRASMAITAEYLPTETVFRNPSDTTPELSRRARGVEIWAALCHLGRKGLSDLIARCCRHARHFARELERAGFRILNEVVLNQVLVSFGDADANRQVIEAIQRDGTCWCGATEWQGHPAMRISVSSWATTEEDVGRSVDAILSAAQNARKAVRPR